MYIFKKKKIYLFDIEKDLQHARLTFIFMLSYSERNEIIFYICDKFQF